MRVTGPQAITQLRDKLQFEVGRHLYAVLGSYAQLSRFEHTDLAQARDPGGEPFPAATNLNRELLARIGDEDLNEMVRIEARRPTAVQSRLSAELRALVARGLDRQGMLVIKQIELLFAYSLDLSIFRTMASNRNHILLLLPGARLGQAITLFHEAEPRFHRTFPSSLIAEDHLWELTDG